MSTQDITYRDAQAITPNDSTDLPKMSFAIYVGGTGTLTVITQGGTQLTFTALPVGSILPLRCTRVLATGTTATLLVALLP